MDLSESGLVTLSDHLVKTLSPDAAIRKPSESYLLSIENQQQYSLCLLRLMDQENAELNLRISAAITLKNFVKRNWRVPVDEEDRIHSTDREKIKEVIVDLMLKSPEIIQNQLSDAISIIGREDFPNKWTSLIPQMVQKFNTGDFHVINGVLRTAHSLFRRYRHEFRSDKLWTEIKLVLEQFAQPLTQLLEVTMKAAEQYSSNQSALKIIFNSLLVICKIFYSLNYQDLPEFFEDNMAIWMPHFHNLLKIDNQLLSSGDSDEAGVLEQIKSQICDNIAMYAQKYDEEFKDYLPQFVMDVWEVLLKTSSASKYDLLVSKAIQFLASVAERQQYKHLFEQTETLMSICEKVILPNMHFRDSDNELFEDNPEEYIRRDIEGSDVDTRRRSACDLVQALCKSFEGPVVSNFSQYVSHLLEEYHKNPVTNWRQKDAALFLVTSLASRGQTKRDGVTQATVLVNLSEFYATQVAPELQNVQNINELPVIKADCIKYVMTFRTQLPHETLKAAMHILAPWLTAQSHVVHTYAAAAVEKLLTVRIDNNPAFTKEQIQNGPQLIINLINILDIPGSEENDYVMKAVMRLCACLQENLFASLDTLVPKITNKLRAVSKNPSKPHFNHYLFETICLCIRHACSSNVAVISHFEQALFPLFQEILQNDVTDFMPYVFQILALMIQHHKQGNVPEPYMVLFPFLLSPILWERNGNIPALVLLLQAYVARADINNEKINPLLGVCQKLISSKTNDTYGFHLLSSIVQFFKKDVLNQYIRQIYILLFQRLQSSKTTKYVKGIIVFFSVFMFCHSPTEFITLVDGIQSRMFSMVIERLFLQDMQKLSDKRDRKMCAIGLTKLLTECPEMLNQNSYRNLWQPVLVSLIKLFELPQDDSVPKDEHFIEVDDSSGYQNAYSKLYFGVQKPIDPGTDIQDTKVFLVQSLSKLGPDNLRQLTGGIDSQCKEFLKSYFCSAGGNALSSQIF